MVTEAQINRMIDRRVAVLKRKLEVVARDARKRAQDETSSILERSQTSPSAGGLRATAKWRIRLPDESGVFGAELSSRVLPSHWATQEVGAGNTESLTVQGGGTVTVTGADLEGQQVPIGSALGARQGSNRSGATPFVTLGPGDVPGKHFIKRGRQAAVRAMREGIRRSLDG